MARSARATRLGLALLLATVWVGCSSGKPISEWGYSSWYHRSGVGAKAEWQRRKDRCLEQSTADGDLEAIDERRFLSCMNGVNWCTKRYNCRRP